jgi:molybdate transport system substrate-binding protein
MNRRLKHGIAVGAIAMLSATACAAQSEPTTSITVYAASSMIKSFTAIGKQFEAANPRYAVQFVFASSSELSTSLADGAQADVFASGDRANMDVVSAAGAAAGTPVPFAANRLVVVTAAGNPQHLTSLTDLARPGVRVAVCAAQSACGSATQLVEDRNRVHLSAVTPEATPTRVIKAVTGGDVDAGVVFTTDAQAAGDDVSWFPLPGDADVVTSWITVVKGSDRQREAAQFVDEVTGADGMRIMAEDGFSEPLKSPVG